MKKESIVTGRLSWKVMYADERFSWFWPPAFDPEQEPLHVESIVTLLGAQPGTRLLDLACGRGWLTVPLAQRGFIVTGCDLSQAMLARAQQAAAQVGVSIAWQRADMRRLPAAWTGRFDYVIHTLSEFGCFAEEAENQLVLAEGRAGTQTGRALPPRCRREPRRLAGTGVVERLAGRRRLSGS